MRIGVVGHHTYFENHFPENWRNDPDILALDVDERDYGWLRFLYNWRPDISLFFRPELYPRELVSSIPGVRVAILSEPIPKSIDGTWHSSSESDLRMFLYQRMAWDAYHWRIYYDPGKRMEAEALGLPVDEYRVLPVDTANFCPPCRDVERPFDATFVGKPTPHRIKKLDFLRLSRRRFLWVAHGVSGQQLAALFRQSKVVLNVHVDGVPAMEPRVTLAAACGALVLTEPLSSEPTHFAGRMFERQEWNHEVIEEMLDRAAQSQPDKIASNELTSLSARSLIADLAERFGLDSRSEGSTGGGV